MIRFSERFEKMISMILLVFAMVIIAYQVIQLIWNTVHGFALRFEEVGLDYAPEYGVTVAVLFFNVLLMMEIMETLKVFSHNHMVKARIILIVCLIAVSRRVLELGHASPPAEEFALAVMILALASSYFLVSRFKDPIGKE